MSGVPRTVAIIGAGRMGCGIAQVFLDAGSVVTLFDALPDSLAKAPSVIAGMHQMLGGERTALERLQPSATLKDAARSSDLCIEAAPERLALKRQIFAELESFAPAGALLATNTSAIPIAEITEGLQSRHRMMGMHFWNPPHLVPLVEVVQSVGTGERELETAMTWLRAVGMEPVHVRRDLPGFIGNRLQHALKREAIALVAEGVCDAETLDTVVKRGFGSRLAVCGPLEQSDLVGLQLTLAIHDVLIQDLDRTAGPHAYLRAKVEAGHTGMAVGRGFREWTTGEAAALQVRLNDHLLREARERRSARRSAQA